MADVSGDRPWYEELAPDLEGDAGRGVEGSRVDSRRRVMAVWRGFEDSRAGVWLAEHTGLLAALSREGSVLVRRLAVGVLLVAMAFTLLLFAAAGGDPVAGGLLSMPFWMAALAVCAVLWAFWDAYRDSGERLVDRLSSGRGRVRGARGDAHDGAERAAGHAGRGHAGASHGRRPGVAEALAGGHVRGRMPSRRCLAVVGDARVRAGTDQVRQDSDGRDPRGGGGARLRAGHVDAQRHHLRDPSPAGEGCGGSVERGPVRRPWPCPYLRPGGVGRGGSADPAQHALDPVAGVRGPDHGDAPRADPGGCGRIGPGVEQQGVGRERGRLYPGASVCGGDQQPADLEMLRVVGQPPQGARGRGPDPRAYGRTGDAALGGHDPWPGDHGHAPTVERMVRREERVRDPRGPEGAFDDGFLAARPASDRSEAHGRGS